MELQKFVTETILQVLAGVKDAQDQNEDQASHIAPDLGTGSLSERIEFDVEVKTVEGSATKGGLGVFVGAVGAGTQGQSQTESSSAGRLRFSVPIQFRGDPK